MSCASFESWSTYQHDDCAILALATPVLRRIRVVIGPVRLRQLNKRRRATDSIETAHALTPAEGCDGRADLGILVNANDLSIRQDAERLLGDLGKLDRR